MKNVLVTGAAGFIGFHLSERLVSDGHAVTGLDNLNDYYDPSLKKARLALLEGRPGFSFRLMDLCDQSGVAGLFRESSFDVVVNLAAQAGVRYSLKNPQAYASSNVVGFLNILEGCRSARTPHLVYASSSSVYGANRTLPFSTGQNVDHPLSLYAATKKSNELFAHAYSSLFGIPCTGLRFFTVFGPWGRPDMAMFLFTQAILEGKPLDLYNNGQIRRDFTYIDDVIEGIVRIMEIPPPANPSWFDAPDCSTSYAPWRIYNIGGNRPVPIMDLVAALEKEIDKKAILNPMPMQPGDVKETWADVSPLSRDTGFIPSTTLSEGVKRFWEWYRRYYKL